MGEPVHLASPMSFNSRGVAATVEQGSAEEISQCVLNIVLCEPGFRADLTTFGVPQPLFQTLPLDLAPFQLAIERWEPRAELTIAELEELAPANRKIVVDVQ